MTETKLSEKLSERLRVHGSVANENFRDWAIEVEALEAELKTLKRQFEAFVDGSNQGLDFKQGVIDGQNILIAEHQKRYDEMRDRLAKAQELIKEVDCGITLDNGLPSDPDFCCSCDNDYDGGECFWLKLKKALGGSE